MTKANTPAINGDVNHDKTICPIFPQLTTSGPTLTTPNPTIAPTIAWVVETGKPNRVAPTNSVPAAASEPNIPYISWSRSTNDTSSIPLRTVSVTCPPAKNAPANSKIAATRIAPQTVRAPDPTLVPIALATSLAPIAQAI